MKNSFLRLLGKTLFVAFGIGVLACGIGWALGWRTGAQFSNALFWPGCILIIIGILSVMGGYGMRSNFGTLYSQSAGDMSVSERTQRWVADMSQGYGAFIVLFLIGGFLIGLSILVGTIF